MTDRLNALTVVLERDIRTDDAEVLISAIRQLRGVLSVEPHVASLSDHVAIERVHREMSEKLWQVMFRNGDE